MLQLNRLVVNPTKTYVAYEEIEYLGYKITGDKIQISDSTYTDGYSGYD